MDQATKEELEEISRVFNGKQILTYLSCGMLPPYGIYRLWKKGEDLRRSEKALWTLIAVMSMYYLVRLIIVN